MARQRTPKQPDRPPSLSPSQAAKLLHLQYEKGKNLLEKRPIPQADSRGWTTTTQEALEDAFGTASSNTRTFANLSQFVGILNGRTEQDWENDRAKHLAQRLKIVEGLIELLETKAQIIGDTTSTAAEHPIGSNIFLVHGHDEAVTHETARFLESLDLELIILREQPNEGRTIIEKFIEFSNVGFAVVLLTGDDRGGVFSSKLNEQKPRARQNVILELGFFLGKLGRRCVCAMYREGVEIPSDYSGVLFIPFDTFGAWRLALAREIKAAGIELDLNKAM